MATQRSKQQPFVKQSAPDDLMVVLRKIEANGSISLQAINTTRYTNSEKGKAAAIAELVMFIRHMTTQGNLAVYHKPAAIGGAVAFELYADLASFANGLMGGFALIIFRSEYETELKKLENEPKRGPELIIVNRGIEVATEIKPN